MSDKKNMIRSSAAEYLTYIASVGNQEDFVELRYENENIWLTQKAMAKLYNVTVAAINQHIKKIFVDEELHEQSVIKKFLITASDGKKYKTNHYGLHKFDKLTTDLTEGLPTEIAARHAQYEYYRDKLLSFEEAK